MLVIFPETYKLASVKRYAAEFPGKRFNRLVNNVLAVFCRFEFEAG